MQISGLQKLTVLDYPGKMAAIVFTQGCNFRCPFCQNSDLLANKESLLETSEVLEYLNFRKNLLDGVVISGGEPTIQPDLKDFIKMCKFFKLDVKLDTNGTNPKLLEELIKEKLIDYIAMDIKNSFDDYDKITGVKNPKLENIKKSIDIIKNSGLDYEFRTTIVKGFHNLDKLYSICDWIGNSKYFIQNFVKSDGVLVKNLEGFSDEELKIINKKIKEKNPNACVRGL